MTIFVTADQHWGHANIIIFCHRKFDSISEHDEELIKAWNSAVGKDDMVYHLGDVTLGNPARVKEIFEQLNGSIRVLGYPWHHDSRWIKTPVSSKDGQVEIVQPIVVLEHAIKPADVWMPIVLCHYPFEVWDRKHYGAVHLHGHSHGELSRIQNRLDVGVDMAFKLVGEYRPLSMEEALGFAMKEADNNYQHG